MSDISVLGLTFDHLWLLPLAVVLPVAAVWLIRRAYRLRRERLERIGNTSVVSRLVPAMVLRAPTWRVARLMECIGSGASSICIRSPPTTPCSERRPIIRSCVSSANVCWRCPNAIACGATRWERRSCSTPCVKPVIGVRIWVPR